MHQRRYQTLLVRLCLMERYTELWQHCRTEDGETAFPEERVIWHQLSDHVLVWSNSKYAWKLQSCEWMNKPSKHVVCLFVCLFLLYGQNVEMWYCEGDKGREASRPINYVRTRDIDVIQKLKLFVSHRILLSTPPCNANAHWNNAVSLHVHSHLLFPFGEEGIEREGTVRR